MTIQKDVYFSIAFSDFYLLLLLNKSIIHIITSL